MTTAHLPDRGVLRISGEDAVPWLHNIATCDIGGLQPGAARHGALLTPQGKILFDFIVSHAPASARHQGPGLYLDTPRDMLSDFAKRLGFYKLRAKVTIEDFSADGPGRERFGVVADFGEHPAEAGGASVTDPRLPALGRRALMPESDAIAAATAGPEAYHARRIALGIPEGGRDFAFGDTFPHEALMDMLGGVDFTKGCYVGQEVVSRMQHRGTARTRIVPVALSGAAPPGGAEVTGGGKILGRMGSSADERGLAMLRLDRVEEALAAGQALECGTATLTLVRPDWWRGFWPQAAAPVSS